MIEEGYNYPGYKDKYVECSSYLYWFDKVAIIDSPRIMTSPRELSRFPIPGMISLLLSEPCT